LEVEISTRGLSFSEAAEKLAGPVKQKLIENLAGVIYDAAVRGAPGRLSEKISVEIGEGKAVVGVRAPYALYVIEGTAPHEIRPVNASCLAFRTGGKMVFTMLVRHPGTRANPFLQRAVAEGYSKVEEAFAEAWKELT
jgi:hypothetical protein